MELPNIEYMLNLMATRDIHKRGGWGVLSVRQNRQKRSMYLSIQSSKRNNGQNKKGRRLIGDCDHDINMQGGLNRGHSADWVEPAGLNIFSIELKKLRLHCGWKDVGGYEILVALFGRIIFMQGLIPYAQERR